MVKNIARKIVREAVEIKVTDFMAFFSVRVGSAQTVKARGKLKVPGGSGVETEVMLETKRKNDDI